MVEKVVFEHLRGRGLRALKGFELNPGPGCNWIIGDNGVGKTTVLEAFYLLSRGRSFRGRRSGPLVGWSERSAELEAVVKQGKRSIRRRWESRTGVEGDAEVGRALVRMLGDRAYELLEGGPALRRRFVDWNVLQCATGYLGQWRRFRRVAAQRNAWLRGGGKGARVWDQAYADLHEAIDRARAQWVQRLQLELESVVEQFPALAGTRLCWRSSVGPGKTALEALDAGLALDVQRGFSASGPSRGDFVLERGGRSWSGSRGENKAFVVLIQIGAGRLMEKATGIRSAWLIDDLRSELSRGYSDELLALVLHEGCQTVVTALEAPSRVSTVEAATLFHVEHGGALARL